jgi:DNA polymerase II small subunit
MDIEGLSVLMYHGFSMDTLVSSLSTLRSGYQNPELVGIEMLKRRHLCSIYGRKPIVPEKKDYLVIDSVPDLFHFGHVHKNGYANYRGTTIINSGTWQDTTDFQLKMGHVPSPCQLPVYELRSATYKVLNFK